MQSVEMIPFGLLAGFVDDKEVRITDGSSIMPLPTWLAIAICMPCARTYRSSNSP